MNSGGIYKVGDVSVEVIGEVELMINAVTCLHCGDFIVSRYRHDFVSCSCPEERRISVDGGQAYQRRVFGRDAKWREANGLEVSGWGGSSKGGDGLLLLPVCPSWLSRLLRFLWPKWPKWPK